MERIRRGRIVHLTVPATSLKRPAFLVSAYLHMANESSRSCTVNAYTALIDSTVFLIFRSGDHDNRRRCDSVMLGSKFPTNERESPKYPYQKWPGWIIDVLKVLLVLDGEINRRRMLISPRTKLLASMFNVEEGR